MTAPKPRDVQRPVRRMEMGPPTRGSNNLPSYRWAPHDVLIKAGFYSRRLPINWQEFTNDSDLHSAAISAAEALNEQADAYLATGRGRSRARPGRHPVEEARVSKPSSGKPKAPFEVVNPDAVVTPPAPHKPRPQQASLDLPRGANDDLLAKISKKFAEDAATIRQLRTDLTNAQMAKADAEGRADALQAQMDVIRAAVGTAGAETQQGNHAIAEHHPAPAARQ